MNLRLLPVLLFSSLFAFPIGAFATVPSGIVWTPYASGGPPARADHAMTYDSDRHVSVLYAGTATSGKADTWEFGAGGWQQVNPAHKPGTASQHDIAYDPGRKRVVFFFGASVTPTWEYDAADWSLVDTERRPRAQYGAVLEYFPPLGRVLLFGGSRPSQFFSETWGYDGTDWTQFAPPMSPPSLVWMGMVYDASRQRLVAFGSVSGAADATNETWEFDGATWRRVQTAHQPPRGHAQSMAFHKRLGVTVLATGGTYQNWHDQTWVYDGVDWTQLAVLGSGDRPSARYEAQMVYDEARDQLVLYGGFDGGHLGDTWLGMLEAPPQTPTPTPTPTPTSIAPESIHFFVLDDYGAVHTGAAANAVALTGGPYFGWNISRALALVYGLPTGNASHLGCLVLDGYGAIHSYSATRPPQNFYFNTDIASDLAVFQKDLAGMPGNIGAFVLDRTGRLWAVGEADPAVAQAGSFAPPVDGVVVHAVDVELADKTGKSGWIMDNFGGVHPFGGAASPSFPISTQNNWTRLAKVDGQLVRMDASGMLAWSGTPPESWELPMVDGDLMVDLEVEPGYGLVALDRFGALHATSGAILPLAGSGPPYFGFEAARDLEMGPPFDK